MRRHAVWVKKPRTGKKILSLVPYAHLLRHRGSGGGSIDLGLDTVIRVTVGQNHAVGDKVGLDLDSYSDFEQLLRFHKVPEDEQNQFNRIHVRLPGSKGIDVEDVFFEWTSMKEWRRAMKMPPKQSDLWRIANKLHLFGEEWDEDEQKAISGSNAILSKLPLPVDMVPAEEQLMLLGMASTGEEAALIVSGGRSSGPTDTIPQLYTAPDPEDDERAAKAIEEMADCMLQLQESVAVGHTDPSVLKVINESRAFFETGVQPRRGLDDVDKFLMRKKTLMDNCGNRSDHWAAVNGVSQEFLCAVRIHMLNESDLDVVCPAQLGAFWSDDGKRCEGGGFNWTRPISEENENQTLTTIKGTLETLLDEYPSSSEEEEALLSDFDFESEEPLRHQAILVRHRERILLMNSISKLERQLEQLSNMSYQITEVREREAERLRLKAERERFRENAVAEYHRRDAIVEFPIDLGKGRGSINFTIREGDSLEREAKRFGEANGLNGGGVRELVRMARGEAKRANHPTVIFTHPVILANGTRVVFRLRQKDNGTEEVFKFCAVWNMTDPVCNFLRNNLAPHVEKHFTDPVLVSVPFDSPDGRRIRIEPRQGQQHDLNQFARDFATASRLPESSVPGLVGLLRRKLPHIFQQRISGEGRVDVLLRVLRGQNSGATIPAFGRRYGIDSFAQQQIAAALQQSGV